MIWVCKECGTNNNNKAIRCCVCGSIKDGITPEEIASKIDMIIEEVTDMDGANKKNPRIHTNVLTNEEAAELELFDGEVIIPEGYDEIGEKAFDGFVMREVIIPNSVTKIDEGAFFNSELTRIFIPKSVVDIDDNVFANCKELKEIIVEMGNPIYHSAGNCLIKTATKTLIAGCRRSIIPTDGSVETIGKDAFWGIEGLIEVDLSTITRIWDEAFHGCVDLKRIVFNKNKKDWKAVKKSLGWKDYAGNFVVECTDGKITKAFA